MAIHVINEAERCLQCKKPMCQEGCPIHTPIPQMIKYFKEERLEEAGDMLFANNPLSIVCSLVCNHENQCEGHCVLGRKGQPFTSAALKITYPIPAWSAFTLHANPRTGKRWP